MYHINFENPCHVYFIGIGGISMSGLAEVLMKEGFTVSGSDSKESPLTDHLSSLGAVIFYESPSLTFRREQMSLSTQQRSILNIQRLLMQQSAISRC